MAAINWLENVGNQGLFYLDFTRANIMLDISSAKQLPRVVLIDLDWREGQSSKESMSALSRMMDLLNRDPIPEEPTQGKTK